MSKKALAAISFGTSYLDAQKSIENIEHTLHQSTPDAELFRSFTSRMIINKLKRVQNIQVQTPVQLLEQLAKSGYREVICQSLHIIPGIEYEKMVTELSHFRDQFDSLIIGKPLLHCSDDYFLCAQAVLKSVDFAEDEALVLMGHGTEHFANAAYCQLENTFRVLGANQVYVGTVEGFPDLNYVCSRLEKCGIKKVLLMPFMIVAGDHAQNDLAGDEPDSWKSILEKKGYQTRVQLKGLGDLQEIADLFTAHMRCSVEENEQNSALISL